MAKTTHVPSQYLGFSIQTTRMVCLLLESAKGSTVSLELFDDIGVTYENGDKLAQQAKSTTSSHNPISDFSKDLWKTFSNWLDSIDQKELLADKTTFEIYISTPKDGKFANELSTAKSAKEVEIILNNISQEFSQKKKDLSEEMTRYVEKVLNFDRSIVHKLFENFNLKIGSGDVWSELVDILEKFKTIPSDIVQDVGFYLLGWGKQATDSAIQNKKPAVIQEEDFSRELIGIIRKLDRRNILQSFAPSPIQGDIEKQKIQTYVLQLGIIEADEDDKLQAINDYLKAGIDRVEWAKRGYVSSDSYDEFSENLNRTWRNVKSKISIAYKDMNEIEKGKLIYAECGNYKTTLQGLTVPDSFVAGNFHALADMLKIGWHPKYEEIIEDLVKMKEYL